VGSRLRSHGGYHLARHLRHLYGSYANLGISALRLAGRPDITEATRWTSRSMDRPFTIFGLI